jgi:hypothetical protein
MSSYLEKLSGLRQDVTKIGEALVRGVNKEIRTYRAERDGVCLLCNNLQSFGHEDSSDSYFHPKKSPSPGVTLLLQDVSLKTLLEAKDLDQKTQKPKRDCRYCRFLCDIFDAFFVDEWMNWRTEVLNGMGIKCSLMIQEGKPLIINCTNFHWESNSIGRVQVDLEVYLDNNNSEQSAPGLPCLGPALSRSENAGTHECIEFVQQSIEQCVSEHKMCSTSESNFVPTRLIYIGKDDSELVLQELVSHSNQLKWAALSHCWGKGQPFKLLSSNISKLKHSINSADLPPTFLNAVTLCRLLAIPYLWIDSLCIIQSDKNDWEIESGRMGSVYSQAFLVICAASSPDPHTAFLGPREEEWLPKQVTFHSSDGSINPIGVRRRYLLAPPFEQGIFDPPFTSSWATRRRAGPLYKRGWCFQEMFMAPRLLHFAPGAIIFECQTHCRGEDQLPPYPIITPGTLGEIDDAVKWRMIVKLYTQRDLTFASDKLPAIGGAASLMPQAQRSKYIAGLWQESLLGDLLWQIMPALGQQHIAYELDEQKAPTWSWASVKLGVVWNTVKDPQWLVETVSVEAPLQGVNPYGAVSKGSLILRGRATPCVVTADYHRNEHWIQCQLPDGSVSAKQHFRTDGILEVHQLPQSDSPVVRRCRHGTNSSGKIAGGALFFCIGKSSNYNYIGLVLGFSADTHGAFERVGNVTSLPDEWYEHGIDMSVTIL